MANNLQRFKEYCDARSEPLPEFHWIKLGPDHQSQWKGTLLYHGTPYFCIRATKREVKEKVCGRILGLKEMEEDESEIEGDDDDEKEPGSSELKEDVKLLRERVASIEKILDSFVNLVR